MQLDGEYDECFAALTPLCEGSLPFAYLCVFLCALSPCHRLCEMSPGLTFEMAKLLLEECGGNLHEVGRPLMRLVRPASGVVLAVHCAYRDASLHGAGSTAKGYHAVGWSRAWCVQCQHDALPLKAIC